MFCMIQEIKEQGKTNGKLQTFYLTIPLGVHTCFKRLDLTLIVFSTVRTA
jgi:hypothetical protein